MPLPLIPVALLLGSMYLVGREVDKQEAKKADAAPSPRHGFKLREQPQLSAEAKDRLSEVVERKVGNDIVTFRILKKDIKEKLANVFRTHGLVPIPRQGGGGVVKGMFKLVPRVGNAVSALDFANAARATKGRVVLVTFTAPLLGKADVDALLYVVKPNQIAVASEGTQWAVLLDVPPKVTAAPTFVEGAEGATQAESAEVTEEAAPKPNGVAKPRRKKDEPQVDGPAVD